MAAGGAFVGIAIANNIARLKSGIEAATASWTSLEARGLTLQKEKVGALAAASGEERPFLSGELGECRVAVHIRSDLVHFATTEVVATPPEGIDATVGVHPSPGGMLGYLRSWIGQDISVGEKTFDEAFLVTAKPEGAARLLLGPALRDRILALAGGKLAGVTYRKERVSVVLYGVEADPAILHMAIDLACAAAMWSLDDVTVG